MHSKHSRRAPGHPSLTLFPSGVIVWAFGPAGLAANAARDLGGRFAALTLFGTSAAGGRYAAISALMSVPATLIAGLFYELVFNNSARSTSHLPAPPFA